MTKSVLLISVLLCYSIGLSQTKMHRKCGPEIYYNTRQNIENTVLNTGPFDAIIHINIKGWGTATFISDSTLITAKHLADKKNVKKIEIYKNIFKNNTIASDSVTLTQKDFHIRNLPKDDCYFISTDISFIVLTSSGQKKIKKIYTRSIPIADYRMLKLADTTIVTLTGYPVDLAGKGKNSSDILCNKQTTFKDLLFDNCNIVGYKLLTCSGDSGGPLWLELNGNFFIIGIHHGGPERSTSFNKEKRNTSALITQEVIRFSENRSQN